MKENLLDVAVVGGGLSGLSAAFRLLEQDARLNLRVFEADASPGGVAKSYVFDDCVVDTGAAAFLTTDTSTWDLCKVLGIDSELIEASARVRHQERMRRVSFSKTHKRSTHIQLSAAANMTWVSTDR